MMQLREVPGFGPVVDGLSWAIGAFDNKDLAFAIALGILVLAFGVFVFLHFFRHRRWVRPIRRLVNALKKLQDTDDDAENRVMQADALFEREIKLSKLWSEYRNHLLKSQKAAGYINLIDPRTWFSLESLPGRGYEHWCSTWAGVFLTIGLLFTFIGLSAALLKVGGIDGADSTAMKAAITGILGVSSAKFITSIAGLVAYIFFSLVTRRYQASQQKAVHELADAIQHLSVPLSPEALLYAQNETASRQLTRMERLTDDLAVAIDAKLEQRLRVLSNDFGDHLGFIQKDLPVETYTPIVHALENLASQLGTLKENLPRETNKPIVQAIENMTQGVAAEFSKQVQQTGGGEIDKVINRFDEIAKELANLKGGLGTAGESFGADIGKAARILSDAAEKMGNGLDSRTDGLAQTIGQFGGKLDNIMASLGQVPENIDKALKATLDKLTLAIGELVIQLQEGSRSGATALTEGGQVAGSRLMSSAQLAGQELQTRMGEVSAKLDSITGALGQVPADISQALNATMNRLTEAVETLTTRLTQGGKDGGDALRVGGEDAGNKLKISAELAGRELQDRLGEVSSKLDHITGALGQVPAEISQALNATMNRLTEAVETLTSRLTQGGKDGGEALREGGEVASKRLVSSAELAGQELQDRIGEVSGNLDHIAGTLGKVPVEISQALGTTMGRLSEAVEALMIRLTQGGQDGGDALRSGGQQAGKELENAVERAGSEFDRQVAEASKQLVTQFATAQTSLQKAITNLATQLNTVESSLKTLPGAVAAQVQNLQATGQTFQSAGQTVSVASGALQQAAHPLLQTSTAITAGLGELQQGIEKAAVIQELTTKASQNALDGLRQAAAAAERTFKTHEDRFGRADADLAKALESLRAGVEQVAKETQGVFAEYDSHITSVVNSLGGVASELQEVAEEMVAARQAQQQTFRRYS